MKDHIGAVLKNVPSINAGIKIAMETELKMREVFPLGWRVK